MQIRKLTRKVRSITPHYIPVEWGTKVCKGKIIAFAHIIRADKEGIYDFYGDDADMYKLFEQDGFTITKEVKDFEDAHKWIKEEVFGD